MFTRPSFFTYGNYAIANLQEKDGTIKTSYLIQIQKYEQECLEMLLGVSLYNELMENVELVDGYWQVKTGVDAKWGKLVNGASFIGNCGNTVHWKGLVKEVAKVGEIAIIESLPSLYIFYQLSLNERTLNIGAGEGRLIANNVTQESSKYKRIDAWNAFVQWADFGYPNNRVSLNQFLSCNDDFNNAVLVNLNTLTYYDI